MKIRLVGTEAEVTKAAAAISEILVVTEQSSLRPDRNLDAIGSDDVYVL